MYFIQSTKAENVILYKHIFFALISILQKLLQRGQERDQFLADLRKAEGPDVLECRQTIQIMQEKLDDREGEGPETALLERLGACRP